MQTASSPHARPSPARLVGRRLPALLTVLLFAVSLLPPASATAPLSGWATARILDPTAAYDSRPPALAVGADGTAFVVWEQPSGPSLGVHAARYTPARGWDPATTVATDGQRPIVAADGAGNALSLFAMDIGGKLKIDAVEYRAGEGWQGLVRVDRSPDDADITSFDLAMNRQGSAVAVWVESNASTIDTYAAWYDAAHGWYDPQFLEGGFTDSAHVALGDDGTAWAVWAWVNLAHTDVFHNVSRSRSPLSGWSAPALVGTGNGGALEGADIATDGHGNAVVGWVNYSFGAVGPLARYFDAIAGWGPVVDLNGGVNPGPENPQVVMDGWGSAIAVWSMPNGTYKDIYWNSMPADGAWGSRGLLAHSDLGDSYSPQLASNGAGATFAVYGQSDGIRGNVWAARLVDGQWVNELVETDNAYYGGSPQVGVDAAGNAVAAWFQSDLEHYKAWGNVFTPPDVVPPYLDATVYPLAGSNATLVQVIGHTEPNATVDVNGIRAAPGADGYFQLLLAGTPGTFFVVVTATDASGNSQYLVLETYIDDPVAPVAAALAAAQANLTSAQALLAALAGDANATQGQLDAAQANVTAAQARVAALEAENHGQAAALDSANATIAGLRAEQQILLERLNQTDARLASTQAAVNASSASTNQTTVQAADTTLPLIVAVVGAALGAAGLGMAVMGRRKPEGAAGPPKEPPK